MISMEDDKPVQIKKPRFNWDKKELMYGFIVIFLLFIMYYLGQISTYYIQQGVEQQLDKCPCASVGSITPYSAQILYNKSFVPFDSSGNFSS